jgi:hypothetical protein
MLGVRSFLMIHLLAKVGFAVHGTFTPAAFDTVTSLIAQSQI